MRASFALMCLGLLSACVAAPATLSHKVAEDIEPLRLDMCNGYQSTIDCDGKPYEMITAWKGRVGKHQGMDFRSIAGTPVISASYGIVVTQSFYRCGGYKVTVQSDVTTPGGTALYVSYAHLKRNPDIISTGARVKPGDVIGYVAAYTPADRCQGFPHVHFFVHTGLRAATHTSPRPYWRDRGAMDGAAEFSCYDPGNIVPGKLTAPLECKKIPPHSTI